MRLTKGGRAGRGAGARGVRWRGAARCMAVALAVAAGAAVGQEAKTPEPAAQSRRYEIPAGSLRGVLEAFMAQSGVLLSIDSRAIESRHSDGLTGSYGVAEGLDRILAPHQLRAAPHASGIYTLEPVPPRVSASIQQLSTVHVEADAIKPEDEAYRTAGSSSYISRENIERFRGTSVGDIFQGTPGVLVGENRNSGGLDVNIRGMQGQGRVPVLVDGARQETTVYRGYAGVASRSYIDPDLIGGIQIEKGPSMSAQGTGAVGGVVSMRTLNADDIVKPGNTFGMRMRGSLMGNNSGSPAEPGTISGYFVRNDAYRTNCVAGSESNCAGTNDLRTILGPQGNGTLNRPDTYDPRSWAGSLALASRLESMDLVAAYATRRQGNYYAGRHGPAPVLDLSNTAPGTFNRWTNVYPSVDGASRFRGGEMIVNSNYQSESFLLKSKLYLPNDQELELSWLRYHSLYGELMPSQLLGFDYARQTESSEVTANTYASRYRWNPAGNDAIDLRANLWFTNTHSINRNYSGWLESNPWASNGAERYRRRGGDLSNTMVFDAKSWGTGEIRYGLAAQSETVASTVDEASGGAAGTGRDGTRDEYSAFLAFMYQPVPSVTLDAGLRHTRYSAQDYHSASVCEFVPNDDGTGGATECETVQPGKSRHSGSAPIASLTWEPLPGVQLYGRYAEALRMPSMFESTSGVSVSTVVGSYLKPEHARNREVGVNFLKDGLLKSSDKLRVKLAYFNNQTSNYLTRTINNVSEGSANGFWRVRNIDSARFNGFELSGGYDMGMFYTDFGITKYTKIEICHEGSYRRQPCTDYGLAASYVNNMIPPNWHGTLTLGMRLLDRKLTLGVRGTFMGARNRVPEFDDQGVNSAFARPVEWHAYRIFDLFASYRINDTVSVDFNLDNATDRYYLDALGLGAVPAPGRTARLSVTLQF
ncbi:putative TonB-dependent receptor precursor [Pigmentiphaga humi]|uniref:Putative TonB-dependent receptor n=1 Tax=Pigmentiphaga humi TaxID=2478468 RepID=A0A3P4B6V6_9BURK|nr:TonB-dependent receptor [Pigmentiphaga humi]VCU71822.1 putative TonB-dependent receptor precursor [Pigmentiphaga humi]